VAPPNLTTYRPPLAGFDEMIDGTGHVRGPWSALLAQLGALSADELVRRADRAGRQLAAEGAGHLLHDDDRAGSARWRLDPLPLVVAATEWERVARGLRQRVELLDAVLDDLYGEQRLVTTGVIPAEVVLGDSGYALAARTVRPLGRRITVYAADLVRDSIGRWVVLRDHTDAPSGGGSALLHRKVLTRVLPVAHRSLRVASHAPWFAALRDALAQLSPPDRPSPRIVVLTPGTDDAEFVEHSYLATHLGYNLTTAGDLAVRRGRLWLRGLSGLEPIDVVLRRVADAASDPLELGRPDAGGDDAVSVGVAGLVEAAREGTVGVANSLGSALGGQLALHPYLAAACQALRGETLLLPTVETWWCGDRDHRATVLDDLDGFVLHDTDPVDPARSVFGDRLTDVERHEWTARISARPHRFVAQRKLQLATAPVLDDGGVRAGQVVVRAHVVLGAGGATVLPGGSARVVSAQEPVLRQPGGVRKDLWITSDGRDRVTVGGDRRPMPQVDLRTSLPSRAAEALFWLGRNAERVEGTCRMALATLTRFEQEPDLTDDEGGDWLPRVVTALRSTSGAAGTVVERGDDPAAALLVEMAGALGDRPGATGDSLGHLLASARTVREFLSGSSWRVVNALAAERAVLTAALDKAELFVVSDSLDRMVIDLMALAGLVNESVVRGPGWRFLDIGRRLERALGLLGLIEATLTAPVTADAAQPLLETLLTACESLVAYRRRYRSDLAVDAVWDLLVDDDANPRSLAFQFDRIRQDLAALPPHDAADRHHDVLDRAAARLIDRPDLDIGLRAPSAAEVRAFVLDVRGALLELTDVLVGTWFAHAHDPRRSGS